MPSPFDQSSYQVRHEWGQAGLARLEPADIVVVVDVLRLSSTLADAAAAGRSVPLADAAAWSVSGAAVAAAAADAGAIVLLGGIRNAAATARAVMSVQECRAARTSVAVIAAGERTAEGDLRFAVEDQLGAGAIIAALTELGVDHCSPEAAAPAEAFRALRRALRHLLTASGSGRELAERAASAPAAEHGSIRFATAAEAAELDAVDAVAQLRDGVFVPFA